MASENGAVHLWKSGTTRAQFTSGTVQICYNLLWDNICDRPRFEFGKSEADVVCHQLEYTRASKYSSGRYCMCVYVCMYVCVYMCVYMHMYVCILYVL